MKTSVFRTVAIGKVDSNRSPGIDRDATTGDIGKILVVPIEWTAMHDGEMTSNPVSVEYKTADQDGITSQGAFIADQVIEAVWLQCGSNRLTPPDVRRGERVEILQVADADKFYWRSLGMDDHLRRRETIIFGISNVPDNTDISSLSADNTYWFEFSTHSKRLAFSSCKSDGEPYQYEMLFDLAEGSFTLNDDIGNFITMVSRLSLIHAQNDKGTFFKLDKKDIQAYAPQDITGNAERDVSVLAGRDMLLKAGRKATINGGGSYMELQASGTVLKTPKLEGAT